MHPPKHYFIRDHATAPRCSLDPLGFVEILFLQTYPFHAEEKVSVLHGTEFRSPWDSHEHSIILSQCNIYEAGQKKVVFKYMPEKAADREEATSGWIRSEGDLFMNGAQPCLIQGAGVESVFSALEHYPTWTMEPASVALKEVLQLCTGWQALQRPADW
ncbi:hypothetical protein BHE74_00024629 [Ensete ventricosum]|nr:hypothetical protein BHE74_00024629 [Ensete ventricosum]